MAPQSSAGRKEVRLTLDSRKRVSLTKLLPDYDICSFKGFREGDRIILEPMAEVPARESWLYKNPSTIESIQRGLDQAETGLVRHLSIDFSSFVGDNV